MSWPATGPGSPLAFAVLLGLLLVVKLVRGLLERLDQRLRDTIVTVLRRPRGRPSSTPVLRMFAAVLLRDLMLEWITGTEADSWPR